MENSEIFCWEGNPINHRTDGDFQAHFCQQYIETHQPISKVKSELSDVCSMNFHAPFLCSDPLRAALQAAVQSQPSGIRMCLMSAPTRQLASVSDSHRARDVLLPRDSCAPPECVNS